MTKKIFVPSPMQQGFMDWVEFKKGCAVLIAVAGSGKSTTIVQTLCKIPEHQSVAMLAFNTGAGKDLKSKIEILGKEINRPFSRVKAGTFHSLGFGALCKFWNVRPDQIKVDGKKCRKILQANVDADTFETYGAFVTKLVGLAKGIGMGCLQYDDDNAWWSIIEHHDLSLDSEDASVERAIRLARSTLRVSNEEAKDNHSIDFDDQLYLPILWRLRLWQNDWVFIDEAQDTNPIRRAIAKLALRPGGRLVAVGDPHQGINGFTGADNDAIEIIKREFHAIELPLTVSYRCPKAAEPLVQPLVPHFTVHESAAQGDVLHLTEREGVARLDEHDAVLCRNTAPLVELAFHLIAKGRGCVVLGKDIGAGLVNLIKQQRAQGVDRLKEKLTAYCEKETAKYMSKGEEEKADALNDRVSCVITVIDTTSGRERTIPGLIAKIEALFSDTNGALTLCTAHKAKGKEWKRVAILQPELMPSKFARQDWQYQQEINLMVVAWTRFQEELIFLDGKEE